ncbi:MAG: hypothetical protein AMXMBFR77_10680 [Phycisphaerales bacterium]|nr:MAG: hypothetical protein BroJett004_04440 [Planctomycetota bacterium]
MQRPPERGVGVEADWRLARLDTEQPSEKRRVRGSPVSELVPKVRNGPNPVGIGSGRIEGGYDRGSESAQVRGKRSEGRHRCRSVVVHREMLPGSVPSETRVWNRGIGLR